MPIVLVLALALAIGFILGAVGGGGSILAVPVLVGVAGLAVADATTASLIVVGTSALMGLLSDLRSGRVRVGAGIGFGLTGVGGAYLGTLLHGQLDDSVMLVLFAALMLAVATKMAVNLRTGRPRPSTLSAAALVGGAPPRRRLAAERGTLDMGAPGRRRTTDCRVVAGIDTCMAVRLLLAGTTVGFLTGLFGVGGGFVIVPALMLVLRFDITEAAATSLLVIAINSFVALALRGGVGAVDWAVVAPFTAVTTAGVLAGRRVAHRLPARKLTIALTVLIVVVAVWTAAKGIVAL